MSEAKRRINYRPDIDAMRGIAVLAVFIYHLNEAWLPGGFAGVDIFFVISGYVVTGSLIGHSTETPWQQLSGFYLRRIRRILPNLLASVGVTSLGIALLVPPTETRSLFSDAVKALYGWSNNRFAAKATDYFGLDSNLNPLSHTWSLGVEEQFYLI
ncbi:acyltransferase, partial [Synechococcus sp. UW140]|uniref:acyltransferase family protein n=1 Tax=Synechococcus sp. UW140 TaxID=368503 RepID=UPI0025E79E66